MRMGTFLLSLFLFLQFCGQLLAYDEPDNFAGLKFGEDLTKKLGPCPMIKDKNLPDMRIYDKPDTRKPCYTGSKDSYELYGLGIDIRGLDSISVDQLNGRLSRVTLVFVNPDNVNGPLILATLNQRYGAATKQSRDVSGLNVSWIGNNVGILLVERVYNVNGINYGKVYYYTKEWSAHLREEEAKAIKKGAKGL